MPHSHTKGSMTSSPKLRIAMADAEQAGLPLYTSLANLLTWPGPNDAPLRKK
jgi:hypothetical protein